MQEQTVSTQQTILATAKARAKAIADFTDLSADVELTSQQRRIEEDNISLRLANYKSSAEEFLRLQADIDVRTDEVAQLNSELSILRDQQNILSDNHQLNLSQLNQQRNNVITAQANHIYLDRTTDPLAGKLELATGISISQLINTITELKVNSDERAIHWQGKNATRKKIFEDYSDRFSQMESILQDINRHYNQYNGLISDGLKGNEISQFKQSINSLVSAFDHLEEVALGLKEKISRNRQSEIIDVNKQIDRFFQNGQNGGRNMGEIYVYSTFWKDNLSSLIPTIEEQLSTAPQSYNLEIQAIQSRINAGTQSFNIRNTQITSEINSTQAQLNNIQQVIQNQEARLSLEQQAFQTIEVELQTDIQTYRDIVSKEIVLQSRFEDLLRNNSHHLLDEGEQYLYQDILEDFNKDLQELQSLQQQIQAGINGEVLAELNTILLESELKLDSVIQWSVTRQTDITVINEEASKADISQYLEQSITDVQNISSQFVEESQDYIDSVNILNSVYELTSFHKDKRVLEEDINNEQNQNRELIGEISSLELSIEAASNSKILKQQQYAQNTHELNEIATDLAKINSELPGLRSNLIYWQNEIQELRDKDGGFFKFDHSKNKPVIRQARYEKYKAAQGSYFSIAVNISALEREQNHLNQRQFTLNNQQSGLQQEINILGQQIAGYNGELSAKQTQRTVVLNRISTLSGQLEEVRAEIASADLGITQELVALQQEFLDVQARLAFDDNTIEDLLSAALRYAETEGNRDYYDQFVLPIKSTIINDFESHTHHLNVIDQQIDTIISAIENLKQTSADLDRLDVIGEIFQQHHDVIESAQEHFPNLINNIEADFTAAETALTEIDNLQIIDRQQTDQHLAQIERVLQQLNDIATLASIPGLANIAYSLYQATYTESKAYLENQLGELSETLQQASQTSEDLSAQGTTFQELISEQFAPTLLTYLREQGELGQAINLESIIETRVQGLIDRVIDLNNTVSTLESQIEGNHSLTELLDVAQQFVNDTQQGEGITETLSLLQQADSQAISNGLQNLAAQLPELRSVEGIDSATLETIEAWLAGEPNLITQLQQLETDSTTLDAERQDLLAARQDLIDSAILHKARLEHQNPNNHNYYFITPEAGTWKDIQQFAESVGGQLVTFDNQKERNFVKFIFTRTDKGKPNGQRFWVGREHTFFTDAGELQRSRRPQLHGIVELDLNSIVAQEAILQDAFVEHQNEVDALFNAEQTQVNSHTYQDLIQAVQQIADLTAAQHPWTYIAQEYNRATSTLADLDRRITVASLESEAYTQQASLHEAQAELHLAEHNRLKAKFKQAYGITIPDSATWQETRQTWVRKLFGRDDYEVELTHLNGYWTQYEYHTQQAERLQRSALTESAPLEAYRFDQQNFVARWENAREAGRAAQDARNQLAEVLDSLQGIDASTIEYQNTLETIRPILETVSTQLQEAKTQADQAYAATLQEWTEYQTSSTHLRNAYDQIIPHRAQLQGQHFAFQGDTESLVGAVGRATQGLPELISSLEAIEEGLATQTATNTLQQFQSLLLQHQSLYSQGENALTRILIAAENLQDLSLANVEYLEEFYEQGGAETQLSASLDIAQSAVESVTRLSDNAMANNSALVAELHQVVPYLGTLSDSILDRLGQANQVRQTIIDLNQQQLKSHQTQLSLLKQLGADSERMLGILEVLEQQGSEATSQLLIEAQQRGLIIAARTYARDFQDLLSDDGDFFSGGVATQADHQFARKFWRTVRRETVLKKEAQLLADEALLQVEQAQVEQALLESDLQETQESYAEVQATINAGNQESLETQRQLIRLENEERALKALKALVTEVITQGQHIQTIYLQETQILDALAETAQSQVDDAVTQTLQLDALRLTSERQAIATRISLLEQEVAQDIVHQINDPAAYSIDAQGRLAEIDDLQHSLEQLAEVGLTGDQQHQLEQVQSLLAEATNGDPSADIVQSMIGLLTDLATVRPDYEAERQRSDEEARADQHLLRKTNTDLIGSAEDLQAQWEQNAEYAAEREQYGPLVQQALLELSLASGTNQQTHQQAKLLRQTIDSILDARQVERDSRSSIFWNDLFGTLDLALTAALSVVSGGAALAIKAIKTGVKVGQAVYNEDDLGAIFEAAKGILGIASEHLKLELGTLTQGTDAFKELEASIARLASFDRALTATFHTARAFESGDTRRGFLTGVSALGGVLELSLPGLQENSLLDRLLNVTQTLPSRIGVALDAFENGDELSGSALLVAAAASSLQGFELPTELSRVLNELEASANGAHTILTAVDQGSFSGWLSAVHDLGKIYDNLSEKNQDIQRQEQKENLLDQVTNLDDLPDTFHTVGVEDNKLTGYVDVEQIQIEEGNERRIKIRVFQSLEIENGVVSTPNTEISNIDFSDKNVTVVLHGFRSHSETQAMLALAAAEQAAHPDHTVLVVDWKEFADIEGLYVAGASQYIDDVGPAVAQYLTEDLGLSPSQIHLTGHSLGAQLAGEIGEWTQQNNLGQIRRINALDAAGLGFFSIFDENQRLDNSDAEEIVSVVTSGLNFGTSDITNEYSATNTLTDYFVGDAHGDAISLYISGLQADKFSQADLNQYLDDLTTNIRLNNNSVLPEKDPLNKGSKDTTDNSFTLRQDNDSVSLQSRYFENILNEGQPPKMSQRYSFDQLVEALPTLQGDLFEVEFSRLEAPVVLYTNYGSQETFIEPGIRYQVRAQDEVSFAQLEAVLEAEFTLNVRSEAEFENNNDFLSNQTFSIDENSDEGSLVGFLSATEPEQGSLTFSFANNFDGDGDGISAFRIEENRLLVNDSHDFDYETNPELSLTIVARDGEHTTEADITVKLQDVNEAPEFNTQTFSVDENSNEASIIGILSATDPENKALTFSFANNFDGDGDGILAFRIEENRLLVNDSHDFDYEANPELSLTIVARDGEHTTEADITVKLQDVNEVQEVDTSAPAVVLNGDAGADFLLGSANNDALNGGNGDDWLLGRAGGDELIGGEGIDFALYATSPTGVTVNLLTGVGSGGDAEGDTLSEIENLAGSPFGDFLLGDSHNNVLMGGKGDDFLLGRAGGDELIGGEGIDFALYATSPTEVTVNLLTGSGSGGDAEEDTLSEIENLAGSPFGDFLLGDSHNNVLMGGKGDDFLLGRAGGDELIGGEGIDFALYATSPTGVTVNLLTGSGSGGDAEGEILSEIENLAGSPFSDTLIGDDNDNQLLGGIGNDSLMGAGGNDSLTGDAGADEFLFNTSVPFISADLGVDTLEDFVSGSDRIGLGRVTFGLTDLSTEFALVRSDGAAETSGALIVFNTVNGSMFYNADGNSAGFGSGGQFATLTGAPALAASDLFIV